MVISDESIVFIVFVYDYCAADAQFLWNFYWKHSIMHPKSWENTKIYLNPHGQDFRVGKKMHQLQKQYDDMKSLNPLFFTVEQRG